MNRRSGGPASGEGKPGIFSLYLPPGNEFSLTALDSNVTILWSESCSIVSAQVE